MKCIVIDDDPMALKVMERLLKSRIELDAEAMFDSPDKAREWLETNKADLVFLDIEMPGVEGLGFAGDIAHGRMVIFTTAHGEYALDAYGTGAIDYLMKPIDTQRFHQAVDRALEQKRLLDCARKKPQSVITVKSNRRFVRVPTDDILYIEGLKDYLIIHLLDRKIMTRITMNVMAHSLPNERFTRVNKSFIINLDKVESFNTVSVCINSREISIGGIYRADTLAALEPVQNGTLTLRPPSET